MPSVFYCNFGAAAAAAAAAKLLDAPGDTYVDIYVQGFNAIRAAVSEELDTIFEGKHRETSAARSGGHFALDVGSI